METSNTPERNNTLILCLTIIVIFSMTVYNFTDYHKERIKQEAETERALKMDTKRTFDFSFNKDKK